MRQTAPAENVRIPSEIVQRYRGLAQRERRTLSAQMALALEEWLRAMDGPYVNPVTPDVTPLRGRAPGVTGEGTP